MQCDLIPTLDQRVFCSWVKVSTQCGNMSLVLRCVTFETTSNANAQADAEAFALSSHRREHVTHRGNDAERVTCVAKRKLSLGVEERLDSADEFVATEGAPELHLCTQCAQLPRRPRDVIAGPSANAAFNLAAETHIRQCNDGSFAEPIAACTNRLHRPVAARYRHPHIHDNGVRSHGTRSTERILSRAYRTNDDALDAGQEVCQLATAVLVVAGDQNPLRTFPRMRPAHRRVLRLAYLIHLDHLSLLPLATIQRAMSAFLVCARAGKCGRRAGVVS